MSALAFPTPTRRGTSPEALLRRALFRLLRWAEQQEGSAVATISGAGRVLGDLVLCHGRLCLAIPATDDGGPVLDAGFVRLLTRARTAGRFSGTLAEAGQAEFAEARRELLRVTATNLLGLARELGEHAPQGRLRSVREDYDARLTFSASEVFVAALAVLLAEPARERAEELARAAHGELWLALTRAPESHEMPYPVMAGGFEHAPLNALVQTSRFAHGVCLTAGGDEAAVQVVSVVEDDRLWQVVQAGGLIVAVRSRRADAGALLALAIRATEVLL